MKAEVLEKPVNRTWMQVIVESEVVLWWADIVSRILGEEVEALHSLRLLNALAAALSLLLFCGMGVAVCAVLLLWFAVSLYHCARYMVP